MKVDENSHEGQKLKIHQPICSISILETPTLISSRENQEDFIIRAWQIRKLCCWTVEMFAPCFVFKIFNFTRAVPTGISLFN